MANANAVVLVEHANGEPRPASLEALGAARAAGLDPVAVLFGSEGAADAARALGGRGASRAVVLSGAERFSPDGLATDLAAAVRDEDAAALLASATSTGRDVLPRSAALLESTVFTDCTALARDGDTFAVTRPWLAGKVVATIRSEAPVLVATLRRNVFAAAEPTEGSVEVSERPATTGKTVLVRLEEKAGGALDVAEAAIVVSGGRGLKGPENFHLIEELAAAFGNAATGASRAVVDAGWRPHAEQVGQTGKTVAPQLYVAVGISGAIQHLAGMRTSKVVVAINKDPDAPIFKVADYGLVGDAFEILPKLTEEIRKIRAQG